MTGARARGGAVAAVTAAALVLLPGTAAADVTVAASRAEPDARNVTITFRVTNADPAVPTTGLQVLLPTARPLLGVRPAAPTGWRARVDTAAPTSEIATAVTWVGGTLAGTGYAVFPVDMDRLPGGAGPLRFHVVQTFADGTTEEWSDLVTYGAPPPAHPALVVPYGTVTALPAGPAHAHHGGGADVGVLPAADGAGWFVALAGTGTALVTAASVALGRRQRRRLAALFPGVMDPGRTGGDGGGVP